MQKYFIILGVLFLTSCMSQEQGFLTSFEVVEHKSSEKDFIYYNNREGSESFVERFSSNKLDLIFIVDFQKGMDKFFKQKIFEENFLKAFEKYDWRLAYTNTGMNPVLFERKKQSEKSSCHLGQGLISTGLGLTAGGHPIFLYEGLSSVFGCFKTKKEIQGANGVDLKFEHKGKVLNIPYLTKDHEEYQSIFNDTLQKQNKMKARSSPQFQSGESYPGYSLLLSLFSNTKKEWLREDSQVVYVIITPQDSKEEIESSKVKNQFEISYGKKERLHIISAVVTSRFESCETYLKSLGVSSIQPGKNLMRLSKGTNADIIDICSQDFSEELRRGIETYLHPTISL